VEKGTAVKGKCTGGCITSKEKGRNERGGFVSETGGKRLKRDKIGSFRYHGGGLGIGRGS